MKIQAAATAFPAHWYDQGTLTSYLEQAFGDERLAPRLRSLHGKSGIDGRHLALPLERYAELTDFTKANAAWLQVALELGESAVRKALDRARVRPQEVDAIFFSTVTGVASPSLDARLLQRLGLRTDCKRVPMFGLGCVAGAAAVARAVDFVRGDANAVAVVLAVELCSLTLQRDDHSIANLISSGLFGDGAAAAVVVGAGRDGAGLQVLATRSVFYPDTEDLMGWQIGAHGFRIVLSAAVPTVARERVPQDVDAFLAVGHRVRADIDRWIAHPGGPKVLRALQDGLQLTEDDLRCSWDSLARAGNLSSASVLMVLEETVQRRPMTAGDTGLMLALGPGFCAEFLLVRWSAGSAGG